MVASSNLTLREKRASSIVNPAPSATSSVADLAAVETVERVSFALLDLLGRQLAGKPVSPLMLFPQYRAAQQLAGADARRGQ